MATPADNDPLIGTVIDGRFEIRAKLGQGGMGTVYRAWQRSVGREVAIKLVDRSISSDPMATRRFLREAHLASQLSHPNTISILDFGQMPDGRLFIAMELLRGRTLGRELRQHGAFSTDRIVRIGLQLCDALEAAHAQRIVHRDLKLDNVMVLDSGNDLIKVLDFGLAKTLDDASTQATAAGIVVGTPRYIAPETAMTGEATPASDMYAIGVILAELALATPLWQGATLSIILQQQLKPQPRIDKVPAPLRDVVARLVDVNPQQRPTAAEARKLLQTRPPTSDLRFGSSDGVSPIAEGQPVEQPREDRATVAVKQPVQRTRRRTATRKRTLIVAGTIVFASSLAIAYFATRGPARPAKTGSADPLATDELSEAKVLPPTQPPIEDPWTAPENLGAIVRAQNEAVRLMFVGVPADAYVTIDNQPTDSALAYVAPSKQPRLIAVRQRDTQVLFEAKSIVVDKNTTVDFTTKQLADCEQMLSSKSRRYCQDVYCARVPGTTGCAPLPPL